MEVMFDDPKLQRLAEDNSKLVRKFGDRCARVIRRRLVELRAVERVTDLKEHPGRWHGLDADRFECWAADLVHPLRIVIRPTPPVPRNDNGGVEWDSVRSVTVVEFVNYH